MRNPLHTEDYMSKRLVIAFAIITLVSAFGVISVRADTPTPTPGGTYFCTTFNAGTGWDAWTSIADAGRSASLASGVWRETLGTFYDGQNSFIEIVYSLPDDTTITSISVNYALTAGHDSHGGADTNVRAYPLSDPGAQVVNDSLTDTSNMTATWNPGWSISAGQGLGVFLNSSDSDGWESGTGDGSIFAVTFCGNHLVPATSTPTLTPTPTLAPPPTDTTNGGGGVVPINNQCVLLGHNSAYFVDLVNNPAWKLHSIAFPVGYTGGLPLMSSTGYADLLLTLSRLSEYKVEVQYHVMPDPDTGIINPGTFAISLGKSKYIAIPVTGGYSIPQVFDIPASNYEPNSLGPVGYDSYILEIAQLASDFNRTLNIDSICVYDATQDVSPTNLQLPQPGSGAGLGITGDGSVGGTGATNEFITCTAAPVFVSNGNILDVFNYVNFGKWVWQELQLFFGCTLLPALRGMWNSIVGIIQTFIYFVQYLGATLGRVVEWWISVVGQGADWLGSIFNNVFQTVFNALITLLNSLGLTDLANGIIRFIVGLPIFISTATAIIGVIWGIVTYWIGVIGTLILTAITAVPLLVLSILNGFNATPAIPIYAAACTSSNTILYGPCLGFYILDNTVFAGPAYYFFLGLNGFIAFNVILSTIAKIQKALTK